MISLTPKKVSGKTNLVLADPLYNLLRVLKDTTAEYNVIVSEETEDMTKVLEDVPKPKIHMPIFCSALQLVLRYLAFALRTRKKSTSTVNDLG